LVSLILLTQKKYFGNSEVFLDYRFSFSVDFEALGSHFELCVGDIHEISQIFSFEDDVVSIFSEHFVNQRRRRIDLQTWHIVFIFEIEKFFVEGIDLGKHPFFDFVLVEDYTKI